MIVPAVPSSCERNWSFPFKSSIPPFIVERKGGVEMWSKLDRTRVDLKAAAGVDRAGAIGLEHARARLDDADRRVTAADVVGNVAAERAAGGIVQRQQRDAGAARGVDVAVVDNHRAG